MIQVIQMILALSVLVVIHEFGHFMFARLFGVRVEKFYVFFNPWMSLFSMKKFGGKWHFRFFHRSEEKDPWDEHPETTEWGIGWVPFGGYCAISGMVDETHDAEQITKTEPQPWEFRSKNVFQRMCIIIGGILMNFIAAMLIFSLLIFHTGTTTLPLKNVTSGLYFSELLLDEGFKQHDNILSINGKAPYTLSEAVQEIIIAGKQDVTVLRGTDTVSLTMSADLGNRYLAAQNEHAKIERQKAREDKNYISRNYVLVAEHIPFVIVNVMEQSAGAYAGLMEGDSIVSVAGIVTPSLYEVQDQLRKHPCDSITLGIYRGGVYEEHDAFIGDQCLLGVNAKMPYAYFELETREYSLLEAIPAGIKEGWNFLMNYIKQFRLVFSKEGAQSVGGFGAIGNMFPETWSWIGFWQITAIISMMLAFMNFLPIPALDGGYILFLLVEAITRKKPSEKFLETANNIGFWLLIALLIFANFNDVFKIFF